MPKDNYRFCPHCKSEVHRSTFFRHKAAYFLDGKWTSDSDDAESHVTEEIQETKQEQTLDKKKYCSHCNKLVSERTFYYHKGLKSTLKDDHSAQNEEIPENVTYVTNSEHNDNNTDTDFENHTIAWSETTEGRKKQRIFVETFIGNVENYEDEEKEGIDGKLTDLWENLSLTEIKNDICSDPKYLTETSIMSKKAIDILHWIVLFISCWAAYFNVSGNAVQHLLHFLKALFSICGYSVPLFAIIAALFPTSLYSLYKLQGTGQDNFTKFVVCPECCCTYLYDDCIEVKYGKKQSKKCNYVKYPNHPHRTKRKACGTVLLKEVTLKNNEQALYPRKIFCYNSLKTTLQLFLDRPGFEEKCERWKTRVSVPGTYRDVYDGKTWKKFVCYQSDDNTSRPFLDLPRHYGLLLNLDWFQPFKHSPYSVGVIYLVVLNLPREERFKPENVILVGILPGPREPTGDEMSFFIKQLTDELLELFVEGMDYKGFKYFAALLGCACDLPAGRKLCGLMSYAAKIGCSKCTKQFDTKGFGEKTDYGGFDTWHPKRDYDHIRREALRAKKAKTQTEKYAIEKAAGCRWSELMRLPYFNATEMCIIDPLHSIYLGVSKYMLHTIFPEHSNINSDALHEIQDMVNKAHLPSDIGRIPYKIASNFSSFTADQHRNWTIYCSIYALKPYLSKEAYEVWKHFVESCWIFTRPVITVNQVAQAHQKMMSFLKGFEAWLGSSKCTPNFHMNSHLAEQILEYGTFYGYWCFSFERYNGIQGNFHTNQRSVEVQLMRKFLRNSYVCNLSPPEEFKAELGGLLAFSDKEVGSLSLNILNSIPLDTLKQLFALADGSINPRHVHNDVFFNEIFYETIGCGKNGYVDSASHKKFLHLAIEAFLGSVQFEKISGGFLKFAAIKYLGEKYGSMDGTLSRNSHVLVNSWLGIDGSINIDANEDRPCEIIYFLKMYLEINSRKIPIVLAYVRWFQKHSAENYYNSDMAKVYVKSIFEIDGPASFVPIQKIRSKFVSGFYKLKGEEVRIVIPKSPKIYW